MADKEEKVQLGLAVGSVAAFMLGLRRLAGAIVLYDGYRAYEHKHKPHAAFSAAVGGAFLLWPTWPEVVGGAIRNAIGAPLTPAQNAQLPAPQTVANFQRASLTQPSDELLAGNWTLYDMSDAQSPDVAAAAKTLKPGQIAALVIGQPSAQPLVFKAKVIPGGAPGRYAGQWVTQAPNGGPQTADFAANHVLAIT